MTVNNTVFPNQVWAPGGTGGNFIPANSACTSPNGGGDLTTDLGEYSCHEQALRIKVVTITLPDLTTAQGFWVLVKGNKQPIPTSIAQKRGSCPTKSTAILGLGLDLPEGCVSTCGNFAPSQALTTTETVKFEGCEVLFTRNVLTGAVTNFENTDPSSTCTVSQGSVTDLEVFNGDASIGKVSFGDGTVSSGDASCNTRLIGGRYYTVCSH